VASNSEAKLLDLFLSIATDYQRIAKLDLENEVKPPSLINSDVGKAIAKARMDKKNPDGKSWTQKDLATKVNEKPQVVRSLSTLLHSFFFSIF
jgi:ribosome-binding protein aMBF1 (putative translation factor)